MICVKHTHLMNHKTLKMTRLCYCGELFTNVILMIQLKIHLKKINPGPGFALIDLLSICWYIKYSA